MRVCCNFKQARKNSEEQTTLLPSSPSQGWPPSCVLRAQGQATAPEALKRRPKRPGRPADRQRACGPARGLWPRDCTRSPAGHEPARREGSQRAAREAPAGSRGGATNRPSDANQPPGQRATGSAGGSSSLSGLVAFGYVFPVMRATGAAMSVCHLSGRWLAGLRQGAGDAGGGGGRGEKHRRARIGANTMGRTAAGKQKCNLDCAPGKMSASIMPEAKDNDGWAS